MLPPRPPVPKPERLNVPGVVLGRAELPLPQSSSGGRGLLPAGSSFRVQTRCGICRTKGWTHTVWNGDDGWGGVVFHRSGWKFGRFKLSRPARGRKGKSRCTRVTRGSNGNTGVSISTIENAPQMMHTTFWYLPSPAHCS